MFSILTKRYLKSLNSIRNTINVVSVAKYSDKAESNSKTNKDENASMDEILGSIATKYQVFRNEDGPVILDVNEEKFAAITPAEIEQIEYDEFEGLNLERGVTGVYEINDLVEVLQRENALDVLVAAVPKELKYVDYMCIVSGRSYRHMFAIAEFVRKLFKIKCRKNDILPKIEGEQSKEWIAMDLGNIALHIFSMEARIKYDLDSLWALGEEYDDECNKADDPIVQLLQKHSIYLRDLVPDDTDTTKS